MVGVSGWSLVCVLVLLGIGTECDVLKLANWRFMWQAWDFVVVRREVLRESLNPLTRRANRKCYRAPGKLNYWKAGQELLSGTTLNIVLHILNVIEHSLNVI